jgi:DNA-binding NarL/FixJ family response regulator
MISLCVADHVPLFLEGMATLFSSQDDFSLIRATRDSDTAASMVEQHTPDVLVASLELAPVGGLELVRMLRQRGMKVAVLLYGNWDSAASVELGRAAHVMAMLDRHDAPTEFLRGVRAIMAGKEYRSQRVNSVLESGRNLRRMERRLERLTGTELQVLTLLAGNRTSREIGEVMCISERTVQKHRQNIGRKLSLAGNNALLSFAMHNANVLQSAPDTTMMAREERIALANMRRTTKLRPPKRH